MASQTFWGTSANATMLVPGPTNLVSFQNVAEKTSRSNLRSQSLGMGHRSQSLHPRVKRRSPYRESPQNNQRYHKRPIRIAEQQKEAMEVLRLDDEAGRGQIVLEDEQAQRLSERNLERRDNGNAL